MVVVVDEVVVEEVVEVEVEVVIVEVVELMDQCYAFINIHLYFYYQIYKLVKYFQSCNEVIQPYNKSVFLDV